MFQNRVNPLGHLITTAARGAWMGNRGLIHDEFQHIVRPFKLKAWLICRLEFKDWKRKIMTPNRYTELFFLDEATAFAAGHRPCFECRRKDFDRFKSGWLAGNPEFRFTEKTSIREIDHQIHAERLNPDGSKKIFESPVKDLPDGCFILLNDEPWLVSGKKLHHWSPFGYDHSIKCETGLIAGVLTPVSVVNVFYAGYRPGNAIR